MKTISYKLCVEINVGTAENPLIKKTFVEKGLDWSEANEEIAKKEAYNGEYTIEDNGIEEEAPPTQEERIAELEAALELLLSGVTE